MAVYRGRIISAEAYEPFLTLLRRQSDVLGCIGLDHFFSKGLRHEIPGNASLLDFVGAEQFIAGNYLFY
jgi:4-alpha-glucanotransferase